MMHLEIGSSKSQLREKVINGCESGKLDLARELFKKFKEEYPESESLLDAEIQYRFGFKL